VLRMAAVSLLSALAALAGAQDLEQDLAWEATVGLDDGRVQAVSNTHSPYRITVSNTLRPFDGTARITVRSNTAWGTGIPRGEIIHEQPLTLPVNSRKEIEGIFLCHSDDTELRIELVDDEGPLVPPMIVGFGRIDLGRRVILVLSRRRGTWDRLRTPVETLALPGLGRQTLHTAPEHFPTHWAAMGPVSTVLWDGERWPALEPRQAEALRTWIARGGTLVMGSGPHWQVLQESILAELLPVELEETIQVPAGTTEGLLSLKLCDPLILSPVSPDDLPPESRLLASLGGHPLLIDTLLGRGHILLCTAELESLWRAAGSQSEVLSLLITPPSAPDLPAASLDRSMQAITGVIAEISRARIPRVETIGRWLLVLWLVLVPGCLTLGAITRRPALAWTLAPAVALVATALIGGRAIAVGLTPQSTQQIQIVTAESGAPEAEVTGVVSLFSRQPDTHSLWFPEPGAALTPMWGSGGMVGVRERYTLRGGGEAGLIDFPMGHQTLRSLAVDAMIPNPMSARVTGSLSPDGQHAEIAWDQAITSAADRWFALWDEKAYEIPSDRLGFANTLTLEASEGSSLQVLIRDQRESANGPTMIETVLAHLGHMLTQMATERGRICLLGVCDEALTPLEAETRRHGRAEGHDPRFGTAIVLTPVDLIPIPLDSQGRLMWLEWRQTITFDPLSGIRGAAPVGHFLPINGMGDLGVLFSPLGPGWSHARPERLTLHIDGAPQYWGGPNSVSRTQPGTAVGHLALFNWQTLRWEEREAPLENWQQSWDNAHELVHPVNGVALAAIWARGDLVFSQQQAQGQISDESLGRGEWSWRRGPPRLRGGILSSTREETPRGVVP
jgi:hypothetical protein